MDNIILRCDNNINGIFTAIYDAFVYKNQMQKENHEVYRDKISIETDKYVMEVFELSRKVNKEADKIRGFIRFSDNGNYLLAHFEPKCDMIPVVMWHFVDRYPGENFVIYDDRRRYAVVHPRLKECFYINESEFEQLERSVPVKTDSFEQLWKVYFEHTDIRERFNPQCQRNLCPKWYRKNMVEFT